jgi:hypothetical protein
VQTLHDIAVPDAVTYLPQTAAWIILFAALLCLALWSLVAWLRHERRNRYRKLALARLADIEHTKAFSELPVLVKQTVLSCCPRGDVASLSGVTWLEFLDETYEGDAFTRGPGRVLPELAYARADAVDIGRRDELVALVRQWIKKHHVRV